MTKRKRDYVTEFLATMVQGTWPQKQRRRKAILRALVRDAVVRSYVGDPSDATPEQLNEAKRIGRELVP